MKKPLSFIKEACLNKKYYLSAGIFGVLFGLTQVLGFAVYNTHSLDTIFSHIALSIILFLILSSVISFLSLILFTAIDYYKTTKPHKSWQIFSRNHIFFILWLAIFILWLPSFLAHFPGIFAYDSLTQTAQVEAGLSAITKFHPPLHTLIWGFFLKITQHHNTIALALYTLTQMLFMSAVFAYFIKYLISRRTRNWLIVFAFIFLSINPIVSMLVMAMTKDVYFAGFFMLFVIELLKLLSDPAIYFRHKQNYTIFILFALGMCLFRNNAIYVFLATAIIIIISLKPYRKKLIPALAIPAVLYFVINGPIYNIIGIKNGNIREVLSVPIQQLSSVVVQHDGELSEDEKSEINKFIPYDTISEKYNPRIVDYIKDTFNSQAFLEDKIGFIKLWLKHLVRYPIDYIASFLDLNSPYWYLKADSTDSHGWYIEDVDVIEGYYQQSKLPTLQSFYQTLARYNILRDIPIISTIFSLSFPIWFTLLVLAYLLSQKAKRYAIVLTPALLLWATYIIGPTSNFRYVFPIFILYPLWIELLISRLKR